MKLRHTPLAALVCGAIVAGPAGAAQDVTRQDTGLSDYAWFKVYPHLERGQKALKANNEARAISSYEHAHEMAPDSVRLTLQLAEAYRHFGHDGRARALLEQQLLKTPNDKSEREAHDVIPVPEKKINTVEQLLALQNACDVAPSIPCRSTVAQNALRLSQLEIAKNQLSDRAFRDSAQGRALANNLSQRAIFLQQWQMADQSFALMDKQKTLSEAQYQQWFAVLLHIRRDERILDLQRQGVMNTPGMQLAYAQSLAERDAIKPLQHYLASRSPAFGSESEERNWLRLLATYSAEPGRAVAARQVKYPANRRYLLTTLLPIRMHKGDWQGASDLLDTFPRDAVLEQRLELELARHDSRQSAAIIGQIAQLKTLSPQDLDKFSFHLVTLGEARAAGDLLLKYWPFANAGKYRKTLGDRLYALLGSHPEWLSDAQKSRLAQPLPTAEQRMQQANLFQGDAKCETVRGLLGDFSPRYDARTWSHLADCYRHTAPGLALYAARRAAERDPSAYYQRQEALLADAAATVPLPEQDDAARGFELLHNEDIAGARGAFEKARAISPDSPEILRQLVYVNQRLDDRPQTRRYVERVVDDIDNTLTPGQALTDERRKDRFDFRRINEDTARRWTFTLDGSLGLTKNAGNSMGTDPNAPRDKSNRSYGQTEAEYRVGHGQILEGDLLSVYGRVFAGSGGHSNIAPVYRPTLGLGVRWKPLRERTILFAVEQQLPLDRHESEADVMLRASASFFNDGRFSDDWHPTGKGWFAQNLYLDAAHYVKQDYQLYTADYRVSWHHKISGHQTIEPYAHVQFNATTNTPYYEDGEKYRLYRDSTLEGIGVRYNHWFGERRYDAFPHRASVGLEYQRSSGGHHLETDSKNGLFLTLGVRW